MTNLPELLAPAGNMDALRAAVAGGADAVYFGAKSFSNRARAKNFDDNELRDAVKFAHSCGVKCHITVNTRVRDREMDDILRLAETLLGDNDCHADALIVADFGVAAEILSRFPNAELHASTQTSLSTLHDILELQKVGFSRIVLPRELSYEEIKSISTRSPLETEIFIHGAHCVSLSGQCLMSYVMGGRSGNRGECAQPCRLSYSAVGKNGNFLSLADMCLAGKIRKVCDSGVASLKIEGRLKPPSYVYGVTSIYRRLLDEGRDADQSEIKALEEIFTRGFTSGYFDTKYRSMSARPQSEMAENISETKAFRAEINGKIAEIAAKRKDSTADKKAVTAKLSVKSNTPVMLELSLDDGKITATVNGAEPNPATGKPLDKAFAYRSLSKLGDTKFYLSEDSLEFDCGEDLWVPASSLNDLRRRCADLLSENIEKAKNVNNCTAEKENTPISEIVKMAVNGKSMVKRTNDSPEYTAFVADPEMILSEPAEKSKVVFSSFSRVFVPSYFYADVKNHLSNEKTQKSDFLKNVDFETGFELCSELPALMPSDEKLCDLIKLSLDNGCRRFLVHYIGQAAAVREVANEMKIDDVKIDFSYRTNITNSTALSLYLSYSPSDVYLSPELPSSVVSKLGFSTFAYGKLPLMTLSSCVICRSNGGKCAKKNLGGRWKFAEIDSRDSKRENPNPHDCKMYLKDRKNEEFLVLSDADCVNYVYNSVPIWMGDKKSEMSGCRSLAFSFTDESLSDVERIMKEYAENIQRNGRRI